MSFGEKDLKELIRQDYGGSKFDFLFDLIDRTEEMSIEDLRRYSVQIDRIVSMMGLRPIDVIKKTWRGGVSPYQFYYLVAILGLDYGNGDLEVLTLNVRDAVQNRLGSLEDLRENQAGDIQDALELLKG